MTNTPNEREAVEIIEGLIDAALSADPCAGTNVDGDYVEGEEVVRARAYIARMREREAERPGGLEAPCPTCGKPMSRSMTKRIDVQRRAPSEADHESQKGSDGT